MASVSSTGWEGDTNSYHRTDTNVNRT
jgi:hypothetical protein